MDRGDLSPSSGIKIKSVASVVAEKNAFKAQDYKINCFIHGLQCCEPFNDVQDVKAGSRLYA